MPHRKLRDTQTLEMALFMQAEMMLLLLDKGLLTVADIRSMHGWMLMAAKIWELPMMNEMSDISDDPWSELRRRVQL
jgi:hypothetical protein